MFINDIFKSRLKLCIRHMADFTFLRVNSADFKVQAFFGQSAIGKHTDRLIYTESGVFKSMIRSVVKVLTRAALACVLVGVFAVLDASQSDADARKRSLTLHNTHTGETRTITFKRNGRYIDSGLRELNRFARDWRRNESTKMDPALFDLIWEVYQEVGARKPIHLVSGYRSPATNEMLRSRSRGVARNSRHTKGQAMDFYIPGVPTEKLRKAALRKQVGGVGYYPKSRSPFVHLDTGNVRHWPKMTRRQLMALFPDGKTLHLPRDGKPLKGYQQALAEYKRGTLGNRTRTASATRSEDQPRRGLFGARRAEDQPSNRNTSTRTANREVQQDPARRATQPRQNTNDEGNGISLPGSRVIAGLFNNNRDGSSGSAPTPPANVSSVPGVASALPTDAPVPAANTSRQDQLKIVPRSRPAAVVELAARLSPDAAPNAPDAGTPDTATPDNLPFQVASAETLQAIENGEQVIPTNSDTPLDARGRIAATALQSAGQQRLLATASLLAPSAASGTAGIDALGFFPRSRPKGDGGLTQDGIDPLITSAAVDAQEALNLQTSNDQFAQDRLASSLEPNQAVPNVPSAVLAYAGLNDDLPPIPEPAAALSALPEQSLTLPVSAAATATISAEEIAEIFSGNARQSVTGQEPTVASRFDRAMNAVGERSVERHEYVIATLLDGRLSRYATLVHPDQRSLAPLLAPAPLSGAFTQFSALLGSPAATFSDGLVRQAMR